MPEEEYGWEEVYESYGCSPLYLDDRRHGDARKDERVELHELPPVVEMFRIEPEEEASQPEELPVPIA